MKTQRKIKLMSVFWGLLCFWQVGFAQLTLEDCYKLATENYPLIQNYNLIKQSSQYSLANVYKGYLPQVNVFGQATYQSDVATLPDAFQNIMTQFGVDVEGIHKDQYKIGLSLNQIIYDGGNMKAKHEIEMADENAQTAQMDVQMYAIKEKINYLYFAILLIEDKKQLNADLQVLLKSNYDRLVAMKTNGTALQSDADAVQAEYLQAKQQEIALQSMEKSYKQMLSVFINKNVNEITDLQKPEYQSVSTKDNLRPELKYYDSQLNKVIAQEKYLQSSIRPRLSLFGQAYYGYTGYDMFADMLDYSWSLNGMVGISLNWNLTSLYTYKNDRERLKVSKAMVENSREVFLFNNNLSTFSSQNNIDQYQKMLNEDDRIISLRQSIRKSAEAKLNEGIIDVNNLLKEITNENQAKIDRSTHEIELLQNAYKLKNIVNQ